MKFDKSTKNHVRHQKLKMDDLSLKTILFAVKEYDYEDYVRIKDNFNIRYK